MVTKTVKSNNTKTSKTIYNSNNVTTDKQIQKLLIVLNTLINFHQFFFYFPYTCCISSRQSIKTSCVLEGADKKILFSIYTLERPVCSRQTASVWDLIHVSGVVAKRCSNRRISRKVFNLNQNVMLIRSWGCAACSTDYTVLVICEIRPYKLKNNFCFLYRTNIM